MQKHMKYFLSLWSSCQSSAKIAFRFQKEDNVVLVPIFSNTEGKTGHRKRAVKKCWSTGRMEKGQKVKRKNVIWKWF